MPKYEKEHKPALQLVVTARSLPVSMLSQFRACYQPRAGYFGENWFLKLFCSKKNFCDCGFVVQFPSGVRVE